MLNCPTRRTGGPWTFATAGPCPGANPYYTADQAGNTFQVTMAGGSFAARGDYAACSGDQGADEFGGGPTTVAGPIPHPNPDPTGVIYQGSKIRFADIIRGTSCTFLVGERYLQADNYYNGFDCGDNEVMYVGCDNDNSRDTSGSPHQDQVGLGDTQSFGSAHSGGLNMLYCDASVHFIQYDVNLASVWTPMGNRMSPIVTELP
jgi:prepilin-type processing-associated H-X9-DG protein